MSEPLIFDKSFSEFANEEMFEDNNNENVTIEEVFSDSETETLLTHSKKSSWRTIPIFIENTSKISEHTKIKPWIKCFQKSQIIDTDYYLFEIKLHLKRNSFYKNILILK